jgi:hypothetical protein
VLYWFYVEFTNEFNLYIEGGGRRLTAAKPKRLTVKHWFYTEVQSIYKGAIVPQSTLVLRESITRLASKLLFLEYLECSEYFFEFFLFQ